MQSETEQKLAQEHTEKRANDLTLELARVSRLLESEANSRLKLEERLRCQNGLLDMTFDAIVTCNLEGQILFWNQGAARLYGWSAEAAKTRFLGNLIYPNDTTRFASNLAAIIAKREYRAEENHATNS